MSYRQLAHHSVIRKVKVMKMNNYLMIIKLIKVWYGVIFLHHGLYEGGVFRFTLFIPDNFECPVSKNKIFSYQQK